MARFILAIMMSMVLQGAESTVVRVLTYNIHHAEGSDGKVDLERIARVIQSVKPDLVAIQEADQKATRSGKVDQEKELARLTGMHSYFGKAMDFQGGAYGQVLLARWPFATNSTHQLPQDAGREPRVAVHGRVEVPNAGPLDFVGTHLDHEIESIRERQVVALNSLFAKSEQIAVLAGDFNARPESKPMKEVLQHWIDADAAKSQATIPAGNPRSRIDYILCRPQGKWRVKEVRVLEEPIASDHRPVFAVLELDTATR